MRVVGSQILLIFQSDQLEFEFKFEQMIALRASRLFYGGNKQQLIRIRVTRCFSKQVYCQSANLQTCLEEIGHPKIPQNLEAFQRVLQIQGCSLVQPSEREGLIPLMFPVVQDAQNGVVGFIIWPQPTIQQDMYLPIVCMKRGELRVQLLAKNIDDYFKRAYISQLLRCTNSKLEQELCYLDIKLDESGLNESKQIAKKGGMFLDIAEDLVAQHLAKQDTMSALITCDWYMKKGGFVGWGRPQEFCALTMNDNHRPEEGRDLARMALRKPWWTLQSQNLSDLQQLAKLNGTAQQVFEALEQAERGQDTGYQDDRPPEEIMSERAYVQLNSVVSGEVESWDKVVPQLKALYSEAGLTMIKNFVSTYS
eukprot:TRINITY_DN89_c0_g1_i4.p1 TRINITY_DN89_c0_g1~~TRINITY_DN89_c0_g1_i4.p1  ORF type:complete len:366 (-),score=56.81 TRINITY_DN89_c0_g1_i4:1108-2205(-)